MSGYGLMRSYQKGGKDYVRRLPLKRILPLVIIYVFLTGIYAVERLLLSENINVGLVFKSFLFGHTIIGLGWYLQVQLLFYVFFYLLFRFFEEKLSVVWVTAIVLAYMAFCFFHGLSYTWYVTSIAFPVGVCYAYFSPTVRGATKRLFLLALSVALCGVAYFAQSRIGSTSFKAILLSLSTIGFVFFVIFSLSVVPIKNKVTTAIGDISLEIYTLQAIYLNLFKSNLDNINNPYLYIILVVVSTIATSIALHPLYRLSFNVGLSLSKTNQKQESV